MAVWNYRERFFPVLLLTFLCAGTAVPLHDACTTDRSTVLALTAIPARSASSAAALPNGTSAPARAIIWVSPGDSDVPATPSCSSRGAEPCPHSRQWYQALFTRTRPSTVVMVLGRRPAQGR